MTTTARTSTETLAILLQVGVIPVVRSDSAEVAIRVTEVLIEAGLPIAEITLTVPNAIDVIAKLAQRTGAERILIGAGTVIDADGARRAIRAGAEFIVSPGVVPDVIEAAKAAGVPVISGALTPTEILAATRAGAAKNGVKIKSAMLPSCTMVPRVSQGSSLGKCSRKCPSGVDIC